MNDKQLVQQLAQDPNFQNEMSMTKKSKNVIQSAQTSINDRKNKTRYVESQQQQKRSNPQTILLANSQYNKGFSQDQSQVHQSNQSNQNLIYYGQSKQSIHQPNDLNVHPSQGNIPMIQSMGSNHHSREVTKQQVVTVPQTMLHKSNKLMNNYLKQSTIQQTGEQLSQ
jgi:hypothetical protein